jgi:hypothetical protein
MNSAEGVLEFRKAYANWLCSIASIPDNDFTLA